MLELRNRCGGLLCVAGSVKLKDYYWFIKSTGLPLFIMFMISFVLFQATQIVANIFLAGIDQIGGLNDATPEEAQQIIRTSTYVYFGFGWLQLLFILVMNIVFAFAVVNSSKFIHHSLYGTAALYTESISTSTCCVLLNTMSLAVCSHHVSVCVFRRMMHNAG